MNFVYCCIILNGDYFMVNFTFLPFTLEFSDSDQPDTCKFMSALIYSLSHGQSKI